MVQSHIPKGSPDPLLCWTGLYQREVRCSVSRMFMNSLFKHEYYEKLNYVNVSLPIFSRSFLPVEIEW